MARIAVFIDHDIMVRHFVLSGVLVPLEREHELCFVFPERHKRVRADLHSLPLRSWRTVPVVPERHQRYRRLYHVTVIKRMRQVSTLSGAATMGLLRSTIGRRAFWKNWACSLPGVYAVYEWAMLRTIGDNTALAGLLRELAPDLVLHPTVLEGLFVSDLIRWGRANRVPTVFMMNSWDNPAVKAMMVGYPDRLAVWGEQTKAHAVRYLGMPAERVACLGAAQFEVYRHPPRESPAAYRQRLGIPPHHKVLLYAGSSKGLNETGHLLSLEQAIEQGALKECTVVYRPHPWRAYPEQEADFFSVNWRHVILEPSMAACYRLTRNNDRIRIELADYAQTHVTLSAVDAVISPLSTILLEAALHGKPIAAYLPEDERNTNAFLSNVSNLAHFTEFFERLDCVKCERADRLVADCQRLLQKTDDPALASSLRAECEYFVAPSEQPYATRLARLIQECL